MHSYRLTHLKELESESMHILREVAAQFDNPTLLFSGGKGQHRLLPPSAQGLLPGRVPFNLLHVDTGHNFEEAITFRDMLVKEYGANLLVGSVQESIDTGRVQEETGYYASRNKLQTVTLLDSMEKFKWIAPSAVVGAMRRRPAPKNACSATATNSASGTPRTSAPNCGTSTTAASVRASTSAPSPSATGRRWTCGSTSCWRRSHPEHLLQP
jgi:3'-phosphoadenosine 5'-phosphosulfate sulfotransferase (PAPS reductase)/FAD synthetase